MNHVPNILSTLRLALAFAFPFLSRDLWLPALFLAGITEWGDGQIARRFNVVSRLGTYLDPVADKMFFLAVIGTLVYQGILQLWQIPLLALRELTVLAGIGWVSLWRQWGSFGEMKPKISGKVTTTVQYGFVISLLWLERSDPWLFGATVVTGAWSSFDYAVWFVRSRQRRHESEEGADSGDSGDEDKG